MIEVLEEMGHIVLVGKLFTIFDRYMCPALLVYFCLLDLCEAANCDDNATCHMYDDIKFANCSCDYGFLGNGTHCIGM